MKRIIASLPDRLGRRGAYLLIKAGLFLYLGLSYLWLPVDPGTAALLRFPFAIIPSQCWGMIFVLCALVAIFAALQSQLKRDSWGFYALIGISIIWAVAYFSVAVAVIGDPQIAVIGDPQIAVIGDPQMVRRALNGAIFFSVQAGVIIIVSGWSEPVSLELEKKAE